MGLERLQGIDPGRLAVFAGTLSQHPAAVQREVAVELERLGYGTLWYGEAFGREAFAQGAILLAATTRLIVASGIANIWARDAMAMVAGGRALAEAWPRRFILGLGVSHAPMVARRGHSYERPVANMRDYLDSMEQVTWRGPEVETPPVVLAALRPRMVALAGERAAGTYPYFTTADHVREQRRQLGPRPFLAADLPIVLAAGRAAARAIGDRHLSIYLRTANYVNNLLSLGWPAAELEPPGSDRLFDAIVAWGELDAIEARARAMIEAGADQVVLNLVTPNPAVPYVDELRRLSPLAGALA